MQFKALIMLACIFFASVGCRHRYTLADPASETGGSDSGSESIPESAGSSSGGGYSSVGSLTLISSVGTAKGELQTSESGRFTRY